MLCRLQPSSRAPFAALVFGSFGLLGCSADAPGATHTYVIDQIRFISTAEMVEVDGGVPVAVVDGFDLDGFDGPEPGNQCRGNMSSTDVAYQHDAIAPDGRRGIDNRIAGDTIAMINGLLDGDATDSNALDTAVQNAVTEGELLLLLKFEEVNSLQNDDHVVATLAQGRLARARVGTDGRLLSDQSFDIRPGTIPQTFETRIRDGVLYLEDISIDLSASILGLDFVLPMELGQMRVEFNENGTIVAAFGAGFAWKDLYDTVTRIPGVAPGLFRLIEGILRGTADLTNPETGECDRISAAMRFHGVSAFIYDEPPPQSSDAGTP